MIENILITAGGTAEPIDRVRSITNTGTGKLGSLIAARFSEYEEVKNIWYVHAKNAVMPECDKVSSVPISSAEDLLCTVKKLCAENRIDAVIHSMAVSDYRVRSVISAQEVFAASHESADIDELFRFTDKENLVKKSNKISSDMHNPVIFLEKTPKVLPVFRKLLPEAVIVGFKLLDHVSHEELIDTAHRLLQKNSCDYVLANDYQTVEAGAHEGYLIDRFRNETAFSGKEAIAAGIAEAVMKGAI